MVKLNGEILASMKNLGFTDYNTQIYVTLLQEGEMDARQLSTKTGVPYSRIYEVLNDMIDKGTLMKIEGRPSTYVANPPQEMLRNLQARVERQFSENADIVSAYLNELFNPEKTNVEVPLTMFFGEKPNLLRLKNLIKNSSRALVLALEEFDKFYPLIQEDVNYLKVTSVDVTVVVPPKARRNAFLEEIKRFGTVIEHDALHGQVVLSDGDKVLVFHKGRFGILRANQDEYLGISGTHSNLHGFFQAYLGSLGVIPRD